MKTQRNRFGGKKRTWGKSARPGNVLCKRFPLSTFERLEMRVLLAADALTSAYYNSAAPHDIPRMASLNASSVYTPTSPAASAPQATPAQASVPPEVLSSSNTASALSSSVVPSDDDQQQVAALSTSQEVSPLHDGNLVVYRLEAQDANNVPITELAPGQDFTLVMFVQDHRPDTNDPTTAGVFSAYANVSYDTSLVSLAPGATITYGSFFGIVRSGSLATAGQIIDAGASASSFTPPGSAEQLLWKVPFHVSTTMSGTATFVPSFNGVTGHDTTVYLRNTAVPSDLIEYPTLNVPIVSTAEQPTVSVDNVSQAEGNTGFPSVVYTITLSSASNQQIVVPYSTTDGSATSVSGPNQDFVSASGNLTFAPNQTIGVITLAAIGDTNFEADETFNLVLGTPTNATLDPLHSTGVATLTNDDFPILSVTNDSHSEGNSGQTSYTFTVTLSGPTPNQVTVKYQTQDNSAVDASDYAATSGTLTFAPNTTSQVVTVLVNGDATIEANEEFRLVLSDPSNATFDSGNGIATGAILNDDGPVISIVETQVSHPEGNSGQTEFVFTVSITTAPTGSPVTVAYTTQNGTDPLHSATAGADYTAVSGTLTFNPGDPLTQTVTVLVNGDGSNEADEDFKLVLSNPANATLLAESSIGTIQNDDAAPLLSMVAPAPITEGNSGAQADVFTVNLSAASEQTITVTYAIRSGDDPGAAEGGVDFQDATETLTFLPGVTQLFITANIFGDINNEANENFKVQLFDAVNAGNATAGQDPVTAFGIINDNDPLPTVSIADPAPQNEGLAGTTSNMVISVSIVPPSGQTVTVVYNTSDGTATTADNDYVATSGTLTFNPGVGTQLITVVVNGDSKIEASETFQVNLSSPQNATQGTAVATATILNDEGTPSISIGNISVFEGNSGTTQFLFTATLSNASDQQVTVNFTTSDGTATTGNLDYLSQAGTLTFAPNTTSQVVTVLVNGDALNEPDENFSVILSNPVGATLGTATAIGTIKNDDTPPTISITDVTKAEGDSGQTAFVFTVSLSGLTGQAVTLNYATADGSAKTAASDYSAASGALTFTPGGSTSQTITVNVVGDKFDESDENFFVNLTNPANATFSKQQGTGTIQDESTDNISSLPSSLSGKVFVDINGNGVKDASEKSLAGTTVTLKGTAEGDIAVLRTTTVAADGTYQFTAVDPGSYSVIYNQSTDFRPGTVQVGSQGGTVAGTAAQPAMLVVLTSPGGVTGVNNNLLVPGPKPESISQRQFLASSRLTTTTTATSASALLAAASSGDDLISQDGDTVTVHGTAGDDTFQFVAGATRTISINGVTRQFSSTVKNFVFDGGGGTDTASLTGSAGDDNASLWIGSGTLVGSGYNLSVNNVTSLSVDGGGGNDAAVLQDSAFSDHLEALGDEATLSNDLGFATSVAAFAQVTAKSTSGGTDTIHLGALDFALAQEGAWIAN